jgi:hypothetical protein
MFIDELQALKENQTGSSDDSPPMQTSRDKESIKQLQLKIEFLEEQLSHARKCIASFATEDNEDKSFDAPAEANKPNKPPDNDTYYFSSYSNTSIHETMLRDTVRTAAYESAILSNAESLFRDKIVSSILHT